MMNENVIFKLKLLKIDFLKKTGINFNKSFKKCNVKYNSILQNFLKQHETYLPRQKKEETLNNIDFLKSIKNYRGMRHALRLPVHGQRTRSNAKTSKKLN